MNAEDIFRKLRLDKATKLLIVNAPEEYTALLADLEYDDKPSETNLGVYDFIQVFGATQQELEAQLLGVKNAGMYDCLFWACYPKGTGKIKSDIKRETVWVALSLIGLEAVTQVAIDETWSALRGRPFDKVGK